MRDSYFNRLGEPQYCPEFLPLLEYFDVLVTGRTKYSMVGKAMVPHLPKRTVPNCCVPSVATIPLLVLSGRCRRA